MLRRPFESAQYTALAFGKRCDEAGVRPSMGAVGDCFDNAMCESFFATLECELLDRTSFKTQAEARMAVFDFIEGWYNLIVGTPLSTPSRPSITNERTLQNPAHGAATKAAERIRAAAAGGGEKEKNRTRSTRIVLDNHDQLPSPTETGELHLGRQFRARLLERIA